MELLLLPSARWNGRAWVDENDLEYPSEGSKSLGKCPRRIGLVSQGLVVRGMADAVNQLLCRRYTCVIVDEAHRARRRNVPKVDAEADEIDERAEPNKLMAFLREIGPKNQKHVAGHRYTGATSPCRGLGSSAYSLPRKRQCARWQDAEQSVVSTQLLS